MGLEDLALVIDGAPDIDHLAVCLDVHCVQMPASLLRAPHGTDPLTLDVDAALEAQILHVP
jgi:hypothetical protein